MNTIIQELVFDEKIVEALKKARIDEAQMYNLLFTGRITLPEYLDAVK